MTQDPAPRVTASLTPEHDWAAAARVVHPSLRPVGTVGVESGRLHLSYSNGVPGRPLVSPGPAGLPLVYVLPGAGFEVLVGADHLSAWGVPPDRVHAAAMKNLAVWSTDAPWVEEISGDRRVLWSDSGHGMDAARILLEEVRKRLASDLAGAGRVLVGMPERDLLIAASLAEGDSEFAELFAGYVADRSHAADQPIDDRVFELVDGELREFAIPDAV
jgi:hypothetical protein